MTRFGIFIALIGVAQRMKRRDVEAVSIMIPNEIREAIGIFFSASLIGVSVVLMLIAAVG